MNMVRLPDADRDGVRTMTNGAAVNQEAVDAAIDDWRSHQLKAERETRKWRIAHVVLTALALAVAIWFVFEVRATRDSIDNIYRRH